MKQLLHKLVRDRSGATTVELAILLAPMLAVIMGFSELGYQSYVRSNLAASLNDVARTAVVEDPRLAGGGTLEERIKAEVKGRMAVLVDNGVYDFKIENFKNFGAIDKPEALVTDRNSNGRYDSGDCWEDSNPNERFDTSSGRSGIGGADDVVLYDVRLTAPHLFPVMAVLTTNATFSVRANALVRTQPYANQRQPGIAC